MIVWEEDELGDEDSVVEPHGEDQGQAEPTHGVHNEVQTQLHPSCRPVRKRK